MAQGQEDGEEEESPVQTRPVPYTRPDPTDTMMKGQKGDAMQKGQEMQQLPAMKKKLNVAPGAATQ